MSALPDLPTALLAQVRTSRMPLAELSAALAAPERDVAQALAEIFIMPYWETAQMFECSALFERLSLPRAQVLNALLLAPPAVDGATESVVAVISNPFDAALQAQLEALAGGPVLFVLATSSDINAWLSQQEARSRAVDSLASSATIAGAGDTGESLEVLSLAALSEAGSQVVRIVNSTVYDALRAGASDVHFESTAQGLVVKYRIDGVLDQVTQVGSVSVAEQVMSRLKVLAELDIAERRVPQDGSFRVSAQGRGIDLRVSIMPSIHGEDAVIRILDKQALLSAHGSLSLDSLGFDATSLAVLRELMEAPYGMLLVTGPTGSGKTTTLYGLLSETHTGRDKIITIEDPVEYQLPGVLQIPVNERKGLTFARGLRSILRHDPDKIMVGEIRDSETAAIAVQSALTGHLVLSTVHANNVFDVFGRFLHMGLDAYALVSALNGIWAQRLLRLNCPHCRVACEPEPEQLIKSGISATERSRYQFMKGRGCGDCRGTGYKGRRAIAEVLRLDDELRELIVAREPIRRLKELARQKGTRSLTDAALAVAMVGQTTLEEVRRVTVAS